MRAMRHWSVRHARGLMRFYRMVERALTFFRPLAKRMRGRAIERPVAAVERGIKSLFFDCKMCGQCSLSHTGMSCPMNCPKALRNGPCGGVRPDGTCEVEPRMPCVWVEAWRGAKAMAEPDTMLALQRPVDHSAAGSSSWLRVADEGITGTLWTHDQLMDDRLKDGEDGA